MAEEIINQIILKSNEGMYFTNGETFGKTVILPERENTNNWYQISEEEYYKRQGTIS